MYAPQSSYHHNNQVGLEKKHHTCLKLGQVQRIGGKAMRQVVELYKLQSTLE